MAIRRGALTSLVHLTTFYDVIDHARRYVGGSSNAVGEATLREAVLEAYTEMSKRCEWSYLNAIGRFKTVAPYSTGTIEYDHTGGVAERLITLSGGTFPADADTGGTIRIASIDYEIDRRLSATTLTLDSVLNPGEDIAAGTSYQFYVDTYTLAPDFKRIGEPFQESTLPGLSEVSPSDWLLLKRTTSSSGRGFRYCLMGDPRRHNEFVIRFWPYPSQAKTVDYPYVRYPRPLVYSGFEAGQNQGTVVTAGSRTITGTGTAFTSGMIGSVIRFSNGTDATLPTGREGTNVCADERVITDVASATSLTVDQSVAQLASGRGVKYTISDPIDLDQRLMTAFKRCVMKQTQITRHMKNKEEATALFEEAMLDAAESDGLSNRPWNLHTREHGFDLRSFPNGSDTGFGV